MEGLVSTKQSPELFLFAFKVSGFIEVWEEGSFGDFRMLNAGKERCE